MGRKTLFAWIVAAVGALLGLIYSTVSTMDFAVHLDRQLHPIHCTLLPGLEEASQVGEHVEGCKVAMFSPYSSFWRDKYWGGIPWSLLGMGLYAFAFALCIWALVTRRGHEIAPNIALILAALIAEISALVFLFISLTKLRALCMTCVGSYIGAAFLIVGALLVLFYSRQDRIAIQTAPKAAGATFLSVFTYLVEMGLAVGLPFLVYTSSLPDYGKYVKGCETLKETDAPEGVLLTLRRASSSSPVETLVVLDPLCPACKELHKRLLQSREGPRLNMKVLLLPFDTECNWMLKDSMHPGACLISRAMICAEERAGEVLDFIFENQEEMRMEGIGKRLNRIREKVVARFPEIEQCLDKRETKIRLNKVLHYAAELALPLLTPQVYLNGQRLCDEDTDLGLDYALKRLTAQEGGKP